MALNPVVASVTFIRQVGSTGTVGSATGFFYTRADELFLVTNRHVVRDDTKKVTPDVLRLRLHRDPNNLTNNDDYDVSLYAGGQPLWKTPPQNALADVAVIRLDKAAITGRFFVQAWSNSNFLPPNYQLDPGEDVFIMGYPMGFYDTVHNLPILRNALIASAYGVPFQGNPYFLTDANLHPGTSGSPIITKPKNTWVDNQGNVHMTTGTTYYLLAIHSAAYTAVGLGVGWYSQLIEDTAASF